MADTALQSKVLRFGTFELDLAARELRKNGSKVRLQDQPFQFLAALVEKPGEVVTREELKEKLWPGDTYVDFDRSLNTAASKLREALGDSASSPRFVETLPRRGYRFLASVQPVGMAPGNGSAADLEDRASETSGEAAAPARTSRVGWYIAGAVLAAGVAAVAWFELQGPVATAPEAPLTPVPLTSYQGIESDPTFSPDGNEVAFSWNGGDGDTSDLYRKLIGPGDPLPLTTDPAHEYAPAWSPDGRYVAFFRDIGVDRVGVFLIPSLGGAERPLMEKRAAKYSIDRLAWSPDGEWLVFSDEVADDFRYALHLLSVATGETRQITFPPESSRVGDHNASFSPDGRKLLFIRDAGFDGAVYFLHFSDDYTPAGEPERLTTHYKPTRSAFWTQDGQEIIFGAPEGLWRVSVASPELARPLASIAGRARDLVVARNGGRFAYSQSTAETDLWLLQIPGPNGRAAPPKRFASSTRSEGQARWSPDGTRVAFLSDRSGNQEIWVCDRDESNPRQLTTSGARHVGWPNWSPDGKFLTYDAAGVQSRDIFVVSANGGDSHLVTTDPSDDAVPSWSRDGKWIYFASQRTGESEIWRIPAEGGEAIHLTTTGGRWPYESPDGKHVYYVRNRELWRLPVDSGEAEYVLDNIIGYDFAVAKRGIYFIRREEGRSTMNLLDPATGGTRWITDIEPRFGLPSVSPDEKWILGGMSEEADSDLMLVENFQ